jgi:hypothetical protein
MNCHYPSSVIQPFHGQLVGFSENLKLLYLAMASWQILEASKTLFVLFVDWIEQVEYGGTIFLLHQFHSS